METMTKLVKDLTPGDIVYLLIPGDWFRLQHICPNNPKKTNHTAFMIFDGLTRERVMAWELEVKVKM